MPQTLQRLPRIVQMLQHIGEHDDVEALLRLEILDVTSVKLIIILGIGRDALGYRFDGDNAPREPPVTQNFPHTTRT